MLSPPGPFRESRAYLDALNVATSFRSLHSISPDEYFQALEPAYHAVFGTGHLTWEWTTNPPIRSFAYPSLFVPAYALVKIWAPKLVQVVFASAGDLALYQIACTLFTQSHGRVTVCGFSEIRKSISLTYRQLFLSLLSPFNVLALTRTLANSTETSLVTIALLYWPYSLFQTRYVALADLDLVLKGFQGHVHESRSELLAAASAITIIDTLYYGALTFTPFSFLKTNLVSGVASFYGVNTFHYYFTQGLPIVLGPSLPFTLLGVWKHIKDNRDNRNTSPSRRTRSLLLGLVAWTIALYSLLATDLQAQDNLKARLTFQLPIRRNHLAYFLAVCLPLNLYLIRWHGSAQIAVTRYLHDLSTRSDRVKSVGVLMPCHSIPGRAYLHLPELTYATGGHRIWEIGCEPPLGLSHTQRETYTSQTDVFFETLGPIRYLDQYFPPSVDPTFPPSREPFTKPGNPPPVQGWNHTWPSHFIMFGALENLSSSSEIQDTVKQKLRGLGYEVVWRIGNGWEEDERRRGGVVVWEWTGLKV
ncbi:glycosyltransferase family 22 protein [Rhizoctonia solani AG-1 IA]|uniref:Mannosyltransferase n=1 Tax=Thanatephorus cucumeris (strain AG1-IA) TaxID=983506 RepID=L8X168_THACA|nr:glycosyltransferase family 22 protein [Rhizoctonia solani AG-1 IA]